MKPSTLQQDRDASLRGGRTITDIGISLSMAPMAGTVILQVLVSLLLLVMGLAAGRQAFAACAVNGTGGTDCTPGTVESVTNIAIPTGSTSTIIDTVLDFTGVQGFGPGNSSDFTISIDQSTIIAVRRMLNIGTTQNINFNVTNSTLNLNQTSGAGGYAINFFAARSNNTFSFENVEINGNFRSPLFETGLRPTANAANNNYYINDVTVNMPTNVGWLLGGAGGEAIFDNLIQLDESRTIIAVERRGLRRLAIRNSNLGGQNSLGTVFWSVNNRATDPVTEIEVTNSVIDTSGRGFWLPTPSGVAGHIFDIDVTDSSILTDPGQPAVRTTSIADVMVGNSTITGVQQFTRDLTYVATGATINGTIRANDAAGDFISTTTFSDTLFDGEFRGGVGSDTLSISGAPGVPGSRILDGGDDVAVADGFVDVLTLDGFTGTVDGNQLIDWEIIELEAGADITFAGIDLVTGAEPGSDAGSGLPYGLVVQDGAFARFVDSFSVAGRVNNIGTVDLSGPNGTSGTVLTVDADYTAGSDLILDADAATTTADVLAVGGDVAGVTSITVLDRSTGPAIPGSPILVVDVLDPGATSPPDAFALAAGPVTLGGLLYNLEQRGEDWFLVPAAGTTPGEPARPIPTLPPAGILTLALLLYLGGRRYLGAGNASTGKAG